MQRNDRSCCYNIHNTHLNPTAHIRDNNSVSMANESYIAMKGSGTQKHSIYKLMTISDSHLILSNFQIVNIKGRISATMLKYHAMNKKQDSSPTVLKHEWSASHSYGLLAVLNQYRNNCTPQSRWCDKMKNHYPW